MQVAINGNTSAYNTSRFEKNKQPACDCCMHIHKKNITAFETSVLHVFTKTSQ